MYQISNFTDNDDVKILSERGAFQVVEYQRDLSVTPDSAITAYYSAQMNVRKRQLVCYLNRAHVTIQAGAMQWMLGNVRAGVYRRRYFGAGAHLPAFDPDGRRRLGRGRCAG